MPNSLVETVTGVPSTTAEQSPLVSSRKLPNSVASTFHAAKSQAPPEHDMPALARMSWYASLTSPASGSPPSGIQIGQVASVTFTSSLSKISSCWAKSTAS
eukprot:scaffold3385_cov241-Pinguiococcus_pyrenoidosus.AAC.6